MLGNRMTPKSLSLSAQLLITLVGLTTVTTVVLTVAALRSFRAELESDARELVRTSADQMAGTVTRLMTERHERAEGFLKNMESLCGEQTPSQRAAWDFGCVHQALANFRAIEHARGALFEYRKHPIAQAGEQPVTDRPISESLARIVPHHGGFDYVLTAMSGSSTLTMQFSSDDLDILFRDQRVRGMQGEIFLTDAAGHFLTIPRDGGSPSPHLSPAEPTSACLQGASELVAADYRGVRTIHGIRPVPVFSGGGCVDAHLAYDEALAPADTLLNQLIVRGAAVAFVGVLIALFASRRIVEPVRRLALSARALEEGDFHRPIPITGPSEIRALARGFVNMAAAIAGLAERDVLTDLPNRRLLNDRLRQAITLAHRRGTRLAVLFLDLDRFKHVNDSLGHEMGDKLLQSVAGRLKTVIRGSDTVSRHGGDEFLFLLPEIGQPADASLSAQKILAAIAAPHELAQRDLHVTASIGISVYPDDGEDAETLIKNADTAMYHGKERGRNHYQFLQDRHERPSHRAAMDRRRPASCVGPAGARAALSAEDESPDGRDDRRRGTDSLDASGSRTHSAHAVRADR
jgi:diguanylate cyclase (GGDEF)-like protein